MATVRFEYYLNSECYYELLVEEYEWSGFMRSFKVRKSRT